ncbi:MAG: DUF4340 domain-containing protein [Myxococcota bacterium]|nr:DUF4340 domain-containing protein [Myxococcota bacterium]
MHRRLSVLIVLNGFLLSLLGLSGSRNIVEGPERFFPLLNEISRLTIERNLQPSVTLQRTDETWIIQGSDIPANPDMITALNEVLSKPVPIDQTIPATPDELPKYGIGPSAIQLTFEAHDGSRIRAQIGRVLAPSHTLINPVGEHLVYRMRSNLGDVFDRPYISWFSTRLVGEQPTALEFISARRADDIIWSISRPSMQHPWSATRPQSLEVGQRKAQAIANTIATLNAAAFVDDVSHLQTDITLEFGTFSGRKLRLVVYAPKSGKHYVRKSEWLGGQWESMTKIAVIPKYLAAFLRPSANDLRRSRFFDFHPASMKRISVDGQSQLGLVRNDKGSWRLIGQPPETAISRFMVDEFVQRIAHLRAVSSPQIVASEAFKTLQRTVTIELKAGDVVSFEIGAPYGDGGAWARVRGEAPERIGIISPTTLRLLDTSPTAFLHRHRRPAPPFIPPTD